MAATTAAPRQGAQLFHALSDQTRLAILARLRERERCVCELQGLLGAAQSRLSFHLKTLREAGLVTDRKQGRWTYYAIDPAAVESLVEAASALRPAPPCGSRDDACC